MHVYSVPFYSLRVPGHTFFNEKEFGYRRFKTPSVLRKAYTKLHRRQIEPAVAQRLAVTAYTQLTDVEDEVNGLLTYDRRGEDRRRYGAGAQSPADSGGCGGGWRR